ncbi:MAG TPA: non-ribosomal peptide synthetase [Pseudonocardiaceae bacterium]|nr:non-ribosomal peptide synthetase [Pseudonocardiaceae bacterium]
MSARRLVHQAIADQARTCPAAPAVTCGDTLLTFAELDARANRLAHLLRDRGVRPEVVVAVCVRPGPDLIVGLLGVLKADGAYLPVDPGCPAERLRRMLADVGATVVLADGVTPPGTDGYPVVDVKTVRDDLPATDPLSEVDPMNLAYVIYTSGSTGRPKGVQITHGALANYLATAVAEYCSGTGGGAPLLSTVSCDLMVPVLYATLLSGQPVRVLPADVDLGRLGSALVDAGPFDFVKLTPSQLGLLTEQLAPAQIAGLATTLVVGGEVLSRAAALHWTDRLAGGVLNSYGPTEATVGTTAEPVTSEVGRDTVPIGRPIPGSVVHVLDEHGRPVAAGATGELHIGGAGLARGYAGQPALTAERFVPDPLGPPGSRMYRTGDLARVLPDGRIDFVSRVDGQVKIRGYRVETGEVEHALTALPNITSALVVPYDAAPGDRRLLAYVVTPELDVPSVRVELARTLPEHMVPGMFVRLDAFPLAPTGKIDRAALPDPADQPSTTDTGCAEGRTDLQRAICDIWARMLFVQDVRVQDNFFDLGGDSLTAVRVMFELQRERMVDIPVYTLYAAPTVAELASVIDTMAPAAPVLMRRRPQAEAEVVS